jgi:hypothetical protein
MRQPELLSEKESLLHIEEWCHQMLQLEEKEPIHVQDIANLTATWVLRNPVISGVDAHESRKQNLEEVSQEEGTNDAHLQDISMILCEDNAVEPTTMKEAKQLPERDQWISGARQELRNLEKRRCWKVVRIPKHRKVIKSKLVFRPKRDHLGKISKFKVRLVAKGFSQEEGVDYHQTFSPVAKGVTFRLALAVAGKKTLKMQQVDVETEEEVYMSPPQGAELPHGYCLKLKKSLYGFKQAPRNWHKMVLGTVLRMGYQQSKLDNCLFFKNDDKGLHLIVLYVDDFIIMSGDDEECRRVKLGFKKEYVIQDLGTLKHYLGITIEDQEESVVAHQRSDSVSILERFAHLLPKSSRIVKGDGKSPQKRVKTPLPAGCKLSKMDKASETPAQSRYASKFPFQQVVGALMYLGVNTRPDLSNSLIVLSKFNKDPTYNACRAAVHVLEYVASTVSRTRLELSTWKR